MLHLKSHIANARMRVEDKVATTDVAEVVVVAVVIDIIIKMFKCKKVLFFCEVALLVFASLLFCSCASQKKLPSKQTDNASPEVVVSNSYTLRELKILDIVRLQDDLFADPNINNMGNFAYSELQTKALRIESMWRTYFIENPDDVTALIIYGKFLRRIGQTQKAYEMFLRADRISPNIAVVKQQLSAIEAEEAQSTKAFAHISQALKLEPNNSTYLKQTAYILVMAKDEFIKSGMLSKSEFDKLLSDCYRKVYENNADNKEEKIRYAQSFYDLFEPDWQKALSLWKEILDESTLHIERQTALANVARILVELGRDVEAEKILKEVNVKNLQRPKRLLLEEIERSKKLNLKN